MTTAQFIILYILPFITTLSMFVIAIYSVKAHRLSNEIKRSNELRVESDKEFKDQALDLYQAIVISNILSGQGSSVADFSRTVKKFNQMYKGETPINISS